MNTPQGWAVALYTNNDDEAAAESILGACGAHTGSATPNPEAKSVFTKGEEGLSVSLPLDSALPYVPGSHCIVNTSLSEVVKKELCGGGLKGRSSGNFTVSEKEIVMHEDKDTETITGWVPTMFTQTAGRPICVLEERVIQKDSPYGLMLSHSSIGSRTRENLLFNAQKPISSSAPNKYEMEFSKCRSLMRPAARCVRDPGTVGCTSRPPWRLQARAAAIPYESFYVSPQSFAPQ